MMSVAYFHGYRYARLTRVLDILDIDDNSLSGSGLVFWGRHWGLAWYYGILEGGMGSGLVFWYFGVHRYRLGNEHQNIRISSQTPMPLHRIPEYQA